MAENEGRLVPLGSENTRWRVGTCLKQESLLRPQFPFLQDRCSLPTHLPVPKPTARIIFEKNSPKLSSASTSTQEHIENLGEKMNKICLTTCQTSFSIQENVAHNTDPIMLGVEGSGEVETGTSLAALLCAV